MDEQKYKSEAEYFMAEIKRLNFDLEGCSNKISRLISMSGGELKTDLINLLYAVGNFKDKWQ